MASKEVHNTPSLVRCYNETGDKVEKEVLMEWFHKYISHFDSSAELLRRCHWKAFLELGNLDCHGNTESEVSGLYKNCVY